MKKLLLASTALVGFAGAAAAAEINLSGYAEIGIFGGSGPNAAMNAGLATASTETQFHNDWQVNFDFSGESDNGLEFGGRVQIEETNSPSAINGGLKIDDEAFWVSGAYGKVTLGETDGAFDWALSEIYSGTSLQDDHSTHAGAYWFTGLDGVYDNQVARYEYSFGQFAVGLSIEMDDDTVTATAGDGITGDVNWALGGKWNGTVSGVDVGAGIGVQDNGTNTVWGLSGSAALSNGLSFSAGYADLDGTGDPVTGDGPNIAGILNVNPLVDSWWGVAVAYTPAAMSALTVGLNYGEYSATNALDGDPKGWGLVANYDLGGGAVAMAGYGSSSGRDRFGNEYGSGNGHGTETFSLGLGLSF